MKKIIIASIVLVLALAIPITLTLISQQQDIRQRAGEIEERSVPGPLSEEKLRSYCERCVGDDDEEDNNFVCGRTRGREIKVSCEEKASLLFALCISCKDTPTPTPLTIPHPINPTLNPPIYNELVDLNDDGKIDELDLNILYSGFSRRKGD